MDILNNKLQLLGQQIDNNQPVRIMIIGLGSVGNYLLEYLIGLSNPNIAIIVAGRNESRLTPDVNIARTAATIRGSLRSKITVDGTCDLDNVDSIASLFERHTPHIVINCSRVYAGLKYGSISWHSLRAYGIWTPLAVRYSRNIMLGYEQSSANAIVINTSYSDAVIPWIKSAGRVAPDFGSGNLNHLVPRIKFAVAEKYGISNLNDIDITLATSHFHDVVISKEGQTDGVEVLLSVVVGGRELNVDKNEIFAQCAIAMPTDQKRNQMNASSNFQIIDSILKALTDRRSIKFHSPGVGGELGGYPFVIDGALRSGQFCTDLFSMEQMRQANRASIALDGIQSVENGTLIYTDQLVDKVKKAFGVDLPQSVSYDAVDSVAEFIINQIIKPNTK